MYNAIQNRQPGFTLIELMIVIAIIRILAATATARACSTEGVVHAATTTGVMITQNGAVTPQTRRRTPMHGIAWISIRNIHA